MRLLIIILLLFVINAVNAQTIDGNSQGMGTDPARFPRQISGYDTLWTTGDMFLVFDAGAEFVYQANDLPALPDSVFLEAKYGLYNSPDVTMFFILNGDTVGTVIANLGYGSPGPTYAVWDVKESVRQDSNRVVMKSTGGNGDAVLGYISLLGNGVTGLTTLQAIPSEGLMLAQNYPNPFNNSTKINFNLARSGRISLELYNIRGESVATLAKGFYQRGEHSILLNAANLASGVYLYRMSAPVGTAVRKLLLVK